MIIGFTRVLYGKDYLDWVIRSMLPYVDKFIISYTPTSSNGSSTAMRNPDSYDELRSIADKYDKVDWIQALPYTTEMIFSRYPEVELAFDADPDEIIEPDLFEQILYMYRTGKLTHFCYRIQRRHLWRSFNHIITNPDFDMPTKIYVPANPWAHEQTAQELRLNLYMYHFGYARRDVDMAYKWETSGHKGELKRNWWDQWNNFPEATRGVFPLGDEMWDVVPFDKLTLPPIILDHPYADLEIIK